MRKRLGCSESALSGCLVWSLAAAAIADPLPDSALDRFDTVAIDPGHGGADRGARGARGLDEKDLVLDVAKRLGGLLRERGLRVLLTRNEDRFVALDASDFCGKPAVAAMAKDGPKRRLAAFRMVERGAVPRPHAPIIADGAVVGQVSSGGYSPTLDTNIGLGYVPIRFATPEQPLQIDVRGKILDARVTHLPFYARPR